MFFFLLIIFVKSHIFTSFHHKGRLLSRSHFKVHQSIHGATTFIVWSSFELMSHYNEDCFTRDLHFNVSNALISSMWNYLKLRFNKIRGKSSKQCNRSVLSISLNHLALFWRVYFQMFYPTCIWQPGQTNEFNSDFGLLLWTRTRDVLGLPMGALTISQTLKTFFSLALGEALKHFLWQMSWSHSVLAYIFFCCEKIAYG